MTDGQINTTVVEPTNLPPTQPATPPTQAVPEVRVEPTPEPLIQPENKQSLNVSSKKAYAFVLPQGSTDDDKQAFTQVLQRAKEEGTHVVVRPDVKIVEL
jgi:hypothetical protein